MMDYYKIPMWTSMFSNIIMEASGLEAEYGLDMHFLNRAKSEGISILEVESVEAQLNMELNYSDELQLYLFESGLESLNNVPAGAQELVDLYNAWKKGDEEWLLAYMFITDEEESIFYTPRELELMAEYNDAMMTQRNTGMVEAAKQIEGTHDFASFQAAGGTPRETTVRTVFSIDIHEGTGRDSAGSSYEWIDVEVTGDGFLYNMVRIIAGTLAEVGYGKIAPDDMVQIIASKERKQAGPTAPPQGLYLKKVYFDEEAPEIKTEKRG